MRVVLVASALSLACAFVCSEASALGVSEIELEKDGALVTATERMNLINKARCECAEKLDITIGFTDRSAAVEGDVVLAVGDRCIDSDGRLDDSCSILWEAGANTVDAVETRTVSFEDLAGGNCTGSSSTEKIVVLVDADNDDDWTALIEVDFGLDLEAPAKPEGEKVVPGESVVEVVFSADDDAEEGTQYQVLCSLDGETVFTPPKEAAFESAADLCGDSDTEGPRAAFVCAEATDSTSSVTVEGLEDGKTYLFEVVAIDEAGNPSDVVRIGTATPAPEEDLWERYERSGGLAQGGHCFIATAAVGDYGAPTVRWLRVFRDTKLAPSTGGRALIDGYYANSPAAAKRIGSSRFLRAAVRPLVEKLKWFALSTMTNEGAVR